MKVTFVSLFKQGTGGGGGRVAHELAQNFAKHEKTSLIQPAEKTGQTKKKNLTIFGIESADRDNFQIPNLSPKNLKKLFEFLNDFNPDIIHTHDPVLLSIITLVWAKINNKPFVHTAHILPERVLEFGASEAVNLELLKTTFTETITHKTLKNFYKNCDAIIALNQTSKDSLRTFGYQGKIYLIPNGRNLKNYQNCQPASLNSQEKILTFTGHISKRKNQKYLIEAMQHLPPNYQLLLLGEPLLPKYQKRLKKLTKKLDLKNITFKGKLPHEKIPQFLAKTHVFTSASTMEVQSLSIIEALASATPVIGLSNETTDELVNSQNGLNLPKDTPPKVFAQKIQEICNLSQEKYNLLAQNARKSVTHLDWSNVIKQTQISYQEIIQTHPQQTLREKDILTQLVSLLTTNKLEKFLLENLEKMRNNQKKRNKLQSLSQVPGTTWLISGLTILISALGHFFFKKRKK